MTKYGGQDNMEIKEVCKRLMYCLDAIDTYVHKTQPGSELDLLTGMLLDFSARLDPQQTIPEPSHDYTLREAIDLLKEDV